MPGTAGKRSDLRCPRCGSTLLVDGDYACCSFVGSQRPEGEKPCLYGLDAVVTVAGAEAANPARKHESG